MKFPHPCGEEFERRVAAGEDPLAVVDDWYVVVRGGTKPIPQAGEPFSCTIGPTLEAAACAVPYNQIRWTKVSDIRLQGGLVKWVPGLSPNGTLNLQHVHVTETLATVFKDLVPNPIPKADRIDAGK